MPATSILVICAVLGAILASDASPPGGSQRPPRGAPASGDAQPSDPVVQAEEAVLRNLETEAGRKYADSAAAASAGPLAAAVEACRDSLASGKEGKLQVPPGRAGLDIYLMLNRRGGVKTLVVRTQGALEACVSRDAPAALVLPSPPEGNYWIKVGVPASGR